MSQETISDTAALCHTCQEVLRSFGTAPDGSKLGQPSQQLKIRAAQGCRLCALFLGAFKGRASTAESDKPSYSLREYESYGDVFVTYIKRNSYCGYYLLDAVVKLVNRPDIKYTVSSSLAGLESSSTYLIHLMSHS